MDVLTEDICYVLDYIITEYKIIDNGEIIDTYYNIKNKEGAIFSQNFTNLKEPFELLCSIEMTLKFKKLFANQPILNL